jgi:hypothetical protein
MIFPVKFNQIDPLVIREKLFKLYDEGVAREDIAKLQLRLKSHFLDDPLDVVVQLATDIFINVNNEHTIDQFFKYKSNVFKEPLRSLTAQKLLDNLAAYKEFKRIERLETIDYMKAQIDNMYSDEKIKEEKLIEYTQGLTRELKRTSYIKLFADSLRNFMPKYNELKHFNANRVATAFLNANNLKLNTATMTTLYLGGTH